MPKHVPSDVRLEFVGAALESYRRLEEVLPKLTIPELYAALELEAAAGRRKAILLRLVRRLVRLTELSTRRRLEEDYL